MDLTALSPLTGPGSSESRVSGACAFQGTSLFPSTSSSWLGKSENPRFQISFNVCDGDGGDLEVQFPVTLRDPDTGSEEKTCGYSSVNYRSLQMIPVVGNDSDPARKILDLYTSHLRSPEGKSENGDWYYWEYENYSFENSFDLSRSRLSGPKVARGESLPPVGQKYAEPLPLDASGSGRLLMKKCYHKNLNYKVLGMGVQRDQLICSTVYYRIQKLQDEPSTFVVIAGNVDLGETKDPHDKGSRSCSRDNPYFTSGIARAKLGASDPGHKINFSNREFCNLMSEASSVTIFRQEGDKVLHLEVGNATSTFPGTNYALSAFGVGKIVRDISKTLLEKDSEQFNRRLSGGGSLQLADAEPVQCDTRSRRPVAAQKGLGSRGVR